MPPYGGNSVSPGWCLVEGRGEQDTAHRIEDEAHADLLITDGCVDGLLLGV
jgi:hypothetical protein